MKFIIVSFHQEMSHIATLVKFSFDNIQKVHFLLSIMVKTIFQLLNRCLIYSLTNKVAPEGAVLRKST